MSEEYYETEPSVLEGRIKDLQVKRSILLTGYNRAMNNEAIARINIDIARTQKKLDNLREKEKLFQESFDKMINGLTKKSEED